MEAWRASFQRSRWRIPAGRRVRRRLRPAAVLQGLWVCRQEARQPGGERLPPFRRVGPRAARLRHRQLHQQGHAGAAPIEAKREFCRGPDEAVQGDLKSLRCHEASRSTKAVLRRSQLDPSWC